MRRDWQIMALLAAATVAVFWQVSRHEFVNYDDPAYVTYNPMVQQGLTWPGVAWAFGELHGEATYWHPVTWLSHMLDCQLFGLRPAGHHLSSLFLHTLNTLLLFVLLRRMTGQRGPSAMVAALFALHPLQVDSVAWIAERKNVLSTFFFMLTLWAYARYVEVLGLKSKVQSQETECRVQNAESGVTHHASRITDHATLFYVLSLVLFALGLMSKPMLVTLPFVMLLLDYWPLQRCQPAPGNLKPSAHKFHPSSFILHPLLLEKLPFLALSAASSVVTIRAHASLGALVSAEQLPVSYRLANAVVAAALYLRKLVWPVDLSVFYMHPGQWPAEAVFGSALLLLGLTVVTVWQARRRPYLIVGWLWFLGTLVPVIGLVQAHVQALADRFAYVPAIGVFVMVVWAAAEWAARLRNADFQSAVSRISNPQSADTDRSAGRSEICDTADWKSALPYGLAGLALAGCVVMTSLQLRYWRNSVTLLQRVVQVEPGSFMARVMLGNALFERRQLDGALRQYQSGLRLSPDYPEAWERAGAVLTELGRPAEAIPYLLKAVELASGWPEAQRRLGLALLRQGKPTEARAAYQKLVALMPATAEGYRDLADMLGEGQQFAEAIHYYGEALRLKPDFEPVLNNLAILRSSCQQREFRDPPQAVQLAETLCRLSQRRNPNFLGTLAATYASAGRFNEAVKTIQEAQALAKAIGATDLLPMQAQMLQQFRAGKPFR
jgi:tetratricopeptide (TPR) repeat protein